MYNFILIIEDEKGKPAYKAAALVEKVRDTTDDVEQAACYAVQEYEKEGYHIPLVLHVYGNYGLEELMSFDIYRPSTPTKVFLVDNGEIVATDNWNEQVDKAGEGSVNR